MVHMTQDQLRAMTLFRFPKIPLYFQVTCIYHCHFTLAVLWRLLCTSPMTIELTICKKKEISHSLTCPYSRPVHSLKMTERHGKKQITVPDKI